MVCLCHVFCIPRQLIRVCDALPTTILLGDGDGKDWGDILANPPPPYFFTILTLPLNIRTLGSPVTTTPQISSTGHLTPGQFPRQPPFSRHFPPKQFPSSDISSPCALRAEKFPSPPEHYTMAKYSGVTIITRIDKLLGPLSELSGAPKYFNRKSFTYFFVYILYPYLFVPRRFVSKASLPLTQS